MGVNSMRRFGSLGILFLIAVVSSLVLAAYSDLEPTVVGHTGQTVTVRVHNPSEQDETARVQVEVALDNSVSGQRTALPVGRSMADRSGSAAKCSFHSRGVN